MKYLFPLIGLGLTAYGVFFKKDAKATSPADLQGAVAVTALPKGSVKAAGPIHDVTVWKAPDGKYYAQQGTSPLVLPITGTNLLNFLMQLKASA